MGVPEAWRIAVFTNLKEASGHAYLPVIFARQPSAWAISHLKSKMKFSAIQEGVVIPRYVEVVQTMWVQK